MNDAHALTLDDAQEWSHRISRSMFRLLVAVPFTAVTVVINVVLGSYSSVTVADLSDPSYGWSSALQGLTIGAAALAWWRPAGLVWPAAVLTALAGTAPETASLRVWLWGAACGLAVLGVVDAAAAARQRAVARRWGRVVVPALDKTSRRAALAWRWPAAAAVGLTSLVAVFAALLWHHDASSAARFRADSEVAVGVVVKADTVDGFWADVAVGNTVHRVPTDLREVKVGDEVGIRIARQGDRAELTDQAFDPTGALALLSLALVGGLGVALAEISRRRAVGHLLLHGGVAVTVGVSPRSEVALLAVPVGATGPVVARLRLSRVDDPPPPDLDEYDWDGSPDDRPPIGSVSDDELLRAAAETVDESESANREALPTTALVVGMHAYGDLPFVRVDEDWWWSARPVADARTMRRASSRRSTRPVAPDDLLGRPAPRGADVALAGAAGLGLRLRTLNQRLPVAVPLLAWVALVPVAFWVFGPDGAGWWGAIVFTLAAANVGSSWVMSLRPRLRIAHDGVWATGGVLDEHVPWARVVTTLADSQSLVVRLVDDALMLPVRPDGTGPALLREARTPDDAARLLEEARLRSEAVLAEPDLFDGSLPGSHRRESQGRRRISIVAAAGAAWGAAVLVPALLQLG